MSTSLSSDTKISIKDFIKKVMKPATRTTESSIIKNYDAHDPVRTNHSYGSLEGSEIIQAVERYPGKLDVNVAKARINEIAEAQARVKARQLDLDMDSRSARTTADRGQDKKTELANMRSELEKSQKEKIKKEAEEHKKKMIERSRASSQDVTDLPID
jgi:hypothetical protein